MTKEILLSASGRSRLVPRPMKRCIFCLLHDVSPHGGASGCAEGPAQTKGTWRVAIPDTTTLFIGEANEGFHSSDRRENGGRCEGSSGRFHCDKRTRWNGGRGYVVEDLAAGQEVSGQTDEGIAAGDAETTCMGGDAYDLTAPQVSTCTSVGFETTSAGSGRRTPTTEPSSRYSRPDLLTESIICMAFAALATWMWLTG